MRAAALAAIGVVAYAGFLVASMPAAVAVEHGQRPLNVRLDRPQGTIWNGAARASVAVAGGTVVVDRVEWRFVPAQLLRGRIGFDIHASSPQLEATARLTHGFDGLAASALSARGDAALLATASALAAAARPSGPVSVQSPHLAWNEREIRGDATLEWRGAAAALPEPRALGSYRAQLHGAGGPAKVTVTTLEGSYVVRAEGTLTPQQLDVRGQAGGQDFTQRLP